MGESATFLKEYVYMWNQYNIFTASFKRLFEYLDRYYLKNSKHKSLSLTSIILYRNNVFAKYKVELVKAILDEIKKERESEITDRNLIKQAIDQFIYMGYDNEKVQIKRDDRGINWVGEKNLMLYDKEFEAPLINETVRFYSKKAELWSQNCSCYEYILKVG